MARTMKIKDKSYRDIYVTIEDFFNRYLLAERGVSEHTIRSYRDTFVQLEDFFSKQLGIKISKLTLGDFTKTNILQFLDWIESKKCSVSTRNNRCAAIKSFARYLVYIDPVHINQWHGLSSIRAKKTVHESIEYLTVEAMTELLGSIDLTTVQGRRDHTMLTVLYYTGARAQELVNLTPSSIRMTRPYIIEVFGKGRKKRIVPIDETIFSLLSSYIKENGLDSPECNLHPLFFNTWREKLTTAGLAYIIKKYTAPLKQSDPNLFPGKISPHSFRHSRAMHLLQSGVELIYIRDLLGHVSIQTTEIYARTDSRTKREALAKAYPVLGNNKPTVTSWEKDDRLKAFLKSLV